MRHIYTSIDIGSDNIKVVVCELYRGRYNLLATSSVKSEGIKKGLITDIAEAKKCIQKAFTEVETMLGFAIKKVIAIIPSYFAEFNVIKGQIEITSEDKLITSKEIISVLQSAMNGNMNATKEMVTVMPIDFKVDDNIMKEPLNSTGNMLSARAIMVTTPKKNIYSVVGILNAIGIEVIDISLGCIGDIYTFKNTETDNAISAVINIGADKTEISIYNKGIVVKHTIVQMGSRNVDSDIAYIYKLDLEAAKNLKEKFALAHKSSASLSETKEIQNKNGDDIQINQYEVTEIVASRIDEILTLANSELNALVSRKPDKIYITGGITNMINFYQICREKLGNCVIIGNVNLIGLRNNKFSSAIGNIIYFVNKLKLKGNDYSMINQEEMEILSTPRKNSTTSDSKLGKLFDYFFGE